MKDEKSLKGDKHFGFSDYESNSFEMPLGNISFFAASNCIVKKFLVLRTKLPRLEDEPITPN